MNDMKSERGMGNGKTMKRESLKGVRGYGASKRQDARCKMEKAGREARDLSRKRLIFVYGYMAVAAAPVHSTLEGLRPAARAEICTCRRVGSSREGDCGWGMG